jgi:hypothetical protein
MINHVKQHKQLTDLSAYVTSLDTSNDETKALDEVAIIMNIYSEKLTKSRNGEFVLLDFSFIFCVENFNGKNFIIH